jgi:hypothetical protein
MKNVEGPPLRIVRDPNSLKSLVASREPSRTLGEHGRKLWDRVTAEFEVEDAAGIELLTLACQSLDRAEGLAARVAEDGEIVRTRNAVKTHPAIKEELACRGFVVRTLSRLGLNYEPLRAAPGRPPGT